MRTEAEMKCDVCGCVTGHLTIAKPPKRPKDECQKCYWTRELNIDGLKAERDAAVAEAWRLNAVEMLKKSAETERDAATARADAAEALVRERTMERDNYGQELDKATGMVEMHVDDAEAARILWRNAEKACALMDAQRAAAIRDRDAAQQMVVEMRVRLSNLLDQMHERPQPYVGGIVHTTGIDVVGHHDAALAILEASAPIAGRWVSRSAYDEALNAIMEGDKRLEAAIAREEKAEAELAQRTVHSRSVGHALRAFYARRELTLQVVAQAKRLKMADGLAMFVRRQAEHDCACVRTASVGACHSCRANNLIAAWDAVPGDVGPVDVG